MKRNNIIIGILLLVLLSIVILSYSMSCSCNKKKEGFSKNIQIVYYAYLRKEKWRHIVLPQMQDLLDCNILSEADLLVALSGDKELMHEAEMEIRKIIDPHLVNLRFTYTEENLYEYPGINALYEESVAHPEKIYLYFHSKGMWFWGDEPVRYYGEKILFDAVVKSWNDTIEVFNTRPEINKVCFGCSETGFAWYNFYWVRGNYVAELDKPIVSEDRYYYEHYIGEARKNMGHEDCYNIVYNNQKSFFKIKEINQYIDKQRPLNEKPEDVL
jgi:hypothetical protein